MSTQDDEDSTQGPSSTTRQETRQAHVLLVDNEEDFRETLRLWLVKDRHWDVSEASTGEEALAKLNSSVDILVLDRRMPDLSGPEVVEQLSQRSFDGDIVVVSAFKPDQHLNTEMVADYLIKPIDRQEFLDTLELHTKHNR